MTKFVRNVIALDKGGTCFPSIVKIVMEAEFELGKVMAASVCECRNFTHFGDTPRGYSVLWV
jgi:hypothetical protein